MSQHSGFDEGGFLSGMVKSRVAVFGRAASRRKQSVGRVEGGRCEQVVVGFFLLGKGQLYGYIFAGRILLDGTGSFDLIKAGQANAGWVDAVTQANSKAVSLRGCSASTRSQSSGH